MPNITLNHVSIIYKNKKTKSNIFAIDDLSIKFINNSVNVLIGESGCGKTSLLKAIAGITKFIGQIFYDDIDSQKVSFKKLNIGYINQQFGLYPHMTVFENIAFPLINRKTNKDEIYLNVSQMLKFFDLEICQNRLPKDLSIGQQQRVAIARCLIKKPSILLMDEPFSNLDKIIKEKIEKKIFNFAAENKTTVIYVTHNIHDALLLSDHIFVMSNGKIEINGTRDEIMESNNFVVNELIKMNL